MTALAYRLLRAFVRWCNDTKTYKGIVSNEAYNARQVRKLVPTPRAKDGDCLQKEQLPAWFKHVQQLSNPVIAAYLQALPLTGPRREELEALKWADVDFRWNSMVRISMECHGVTARHWRRCWKHRRGPPAEER